MEKSSGWKGWGNYCLWTLELSFIKSRAVRTKLIRLQMKEIFEPVIEIPCWVIFFSKRSQVTYTSKGFTRFKNNLCRHLIPLWYFALTFSSVVRVPGFDDKTEWTLEKEWERYCYKGCCQVLFCWDWSVLKHISRGKEIMSSVRFPSNIALGFR